MRVGDFFDDDRHVAVQASLGVKLVSPLARKAFQQEILPQIEEMVSDKETADGLFAETYSLLDAAFKNKNESYTRLIQYKGIDQSDASFLSDLLYSLTEWYENTRKLFMGEESPKSESSITLQDLVNE